MSEDATLLSELTLLAAGDKKAFRILYHRYYQVLVLYCMSLLSDKTTAEDIVQDVFYALWKQHPSFDHPSILKSYLYNSVRNKSVDFLRHRNAQSNYVEQMLNSHPSFNVSAQGEEDFFSEEIYRQLFHAIENMPDRQREIFKLYLDGKSNADIAEALQISVETVKTQTRRGKEYLRKNLSLESFALFLYLIS